MIPSLRSLALAGLCTLGAPALAAQDTAVVREGVRIGLAYRPGTKPGVLLLPIRGTYGDSAQAILARDFDFSDRFTVTSTGANEAPPSGPLNYPLYARLGASAIVQATISGAGALHVALHDVAAGKVMNVQDFPLASPALGPGWRLGVHAAADEIERWITGATGIAATRILFVRGGTLWQVDSDGENDVEVPGVGSALSPAWHPTGRYIAYGVLGDAGAYVALRDLSAGSSRRVSRGGGTALSPAFSPDGQTLVYAAGEDGTDLYAVNAFQSGDTPRRVTVGRGTTNSSPSFSPDGRRIAFTSGRLGHPEVYITDADGANAELLTTTGFGDQLYRSNPDWSPNGRQVAFQSMIEGRFQIATIGLQDRSVRQHTQEGQNEDPSWAPDSRHLVFTSSRSGTRQLWVLDTESGRLRQLTRGAASRMADWSPRLDAPR